MPTLVRALGLVLVLAADRGPIVAQAVPPGGPYAQPPGAVGRDSIPPSRLPLPPRSAAEAEGPVGRSVIPSYRLTSPVTVFGSLAAVLGLFFVVAWALRRAAPRESAPLPAEVVELLGRKILSQRHKLELVRCGKKLLLVSLTPDGAETLTEITDPVEVDRLAGLCRQSQPGSATVTFRQMFQQFSSERPSQGGRHG